jgi:RNA polymerase sigma-70 factor (ECF subfamily)
MSDAELVARARLGDRAAFGELIERHWAAVYRAARAALGSDAEADDVAQEACLTAYRRLTGFRGDASFKTWLLTITWHQAMNRRRLVSRWWRVLAPNGSGTAQDGERASGERSAEQAIADRQLHAAIHAEILALSPSLRDALLLALTGEHSYEEIGAMLQAPVGTVKWRVSEARRVIKRRLRARGHGDVG